MATDGMNKGVGVKVDNKPTLSNIFQRQATEINILSDNINQLNEIIRILGGVTEEPFAKIELINVSVIEDFNNITYHLSGQNKRLEEVLLKLNSIIH